MGELRTGVVGGSSCAAIARAPAWHTMGELRTGVVGASGFAGAELMRLLAGHPDLDLQVVTGDTQAGTPVAELYPSLMPVYGDMTYEAYDAEKLAELDVVFLGLPHMASQPVVTDLFGRVGCIVDLGSDFRLRDASLYPRWYGTEHAQPDLLSEFVYGLPELHRDELRGAKAVAVPGCYPTAAVLALAPFVKRGLVESTGIIVDAASGVSGAGRAPKANTTFAAVDENFSAYGLEGHRHTPEIEQELGCDVMFTPHLAPMVRGILATCYARPTTAVADSWATATSSASGGQASGGQASGGQALRVLHEAYGSEPFVVVTESTPHTKATAGANTAHLTARFDERTGWLVVLCAIDNLVKGAAGNAIQCANLALGLPETQGLPVSGLMP